MAEAVSMEKKELLFHHVCNQEGCHIRRNGYGFFALCGRGIRKSSSLHPLNHCKKERRSYK
ncbi:hypothetical protein B6259_02560 [Ruminococcaceae bacterium CPB6]|nr:hypothetical protein B6259_02560 [Ruminococcaceae bacterium CPB6]